MAWGEFHLRAVKRTLLDQQAQAAIDVVQRQLLGGQGRGARGESPWSAARTRTQVLADVSQQVDARDDDAKVGASAITLAERGPPSRLISRPRTARAIDAR